jgi:hypothetical protein
MICKKSHLVLPCRHHQRLAAWKTKSMENHTTKTVTLDPPEIRFRSEKATGLLAKINTGLL